MATAMVSSDAMGGDDAGSHLKPAQKAEESGKQCCDSGNHCHTALQRGMWTMTLGCIVAEPFLYILWSKDFASADNCVAFWTSTITLIGLLFMTYYSYPERSIESMLYPDPYRDASALANDPSAVKKIPFWTRHFGTPMLWTGWIFVVSSLPIAAMGVALCVYGDVESGISYIVFFVVYGWLMYLAVLASYPESLVTHEGVFYRWIESRTGRPIIGFLLLANVKDDEDFTACALCPCMPNVDERTLIKYFGNDMSLLTLLYFVLGVALAVDNIVWVVSDPESYLAWACLVCAIIFSVGSWMTYTAFVDLMGTFLPPSLHEHTEKETSSLLAAP